MFPNLKLQIFRRGSHQNQLARAVGMDETLLSKIIHGCREPSRFQRGVLAHYLEADEEWLFERFEVPKPQPVRGSVALTAVAKRKANKNGGI